jgi:hypothetical protein
MSDRSGQLSLPFRVFSTWTLAVVSQTPLTRLRHIFQTDPIGCSARLCFSDVSVWTGPLPSSQTHWMCTVEALGLQRDGMAADEEMRARLVSKAARVQRVVRML